MTKRHISYKVARDYERKNESGKVEFELKGADYRASGTV